MYILYDAESSCNVVNFVRDLPVNEDHPVAKASRMVDISPTCSKIRLDSEVKLMMLCNFLETSMIFGVLSINSRYIYRPTVLTYLGIFAECA